MRIVKLDCGLVTKCFPIGIAPPEAPDHIGQRTGNKKVLLQKSQSLPHARGVVGIQYTCKGFGGQRLRQRAYKVAAAELLKIEEIGSGRGPEPKRIDGLATVANDWAVKRDAEKA